VSCSGISWAIRKSAPRSRQITTPAPHHSVFYRPDALPAAQPTAAKHWRVKKKHLLSHKWKNEDTIHKDRQHRVRIWLMRRDIQRSIASTHWRNFCKGANKYYSQQKYLILVHATKSGWKTGTRCMCAKFWRNATIQIRSIYTAIRNVSPKSFWHSNADM